MEISAKDLERHYREMSDGELLAIDPAELTEVGAKVHAAEMSRRGLDAAETDHTESELEAETGERWVSAGIFRFHDEVQALLPVLRHHGIQVETESDADDVIWMGANTYPPNRLLVPEAQLHEARSVIENFANAEEMAARDEAAAPPRTVMARFEDGVFKPTEPVEGVAEGAEVEVLLPH